MKRFLVFSIIVFASSAFANSHKYWSKNKLDGYSDSLSSKVKNHLAFEQLGEFGSHFALVAHRTGTGTSESHDNDTDFYIVQVGEATLHIGGKIVNPKEVSPGEIRGTSIKGGKTILLKAGDTVNIPPATPHHIVIDPGKSITYMILKIHR